MGLSLIMHLRKGWWLLTEFRALARRSPRSCKALSWSEALWQESGPQEYLWISWQLMCVGNGGTVFAVGVSLQGANSWPLRLHQIPRAWGRWVVMGEWELGGVLGDVKEGKSKLCKRCPAIGTSGSWVPRGRGSASQAPAEKTMLSLDFQ